MRCLKAAALALGLSLAAGTASAIDPFFPTFGNDGIDVIHYGLDLDVNPRSGRLEAWAVLDIQAQQRLTQFSLDLHALIVSKVTVNGAPAAFEQEDDKLTIIPRREIPKNARFRVYVTYSGTPDPIQDPTAPGDPELRLGWFKYRNASYAVSEPVGASTFFPANDEPTDKARFTIAVTVPSPFGAAANGTLTGYRTFAGKRRFVWEMREPMTTWLATVHVNRFNVKTVAARTSRFGARGTPVSVFYTAATPKADVENYALASKMLPFFEKLVGDYPFDSYGSVVVDDPLLYYALETQAMSTFPLGAAGEDFVAHELAHQWFGNSVSIAKWEDLWIAEGAATYFEVLWPNRDDPAAFDAAMRGIYDYIVAENVGPAVVEAPEEMFTDRTYLRGASALYALRLKVGDRTFFRILRAFHDFYRGRNATSRDFINAAAFISQDASVRPLLRAWLYEDPVPPLPGQPAFGKRRGTVAKPNVIGVRCGPLSHRGAPASCR